MHGAAALPAQRSARAPRYPASPLLLTALRTLQSNPANAFTVQDVLCPTSAEEPCCIVNSTCDLIEPAAPADTDAGRTFYFGQDSDAYTIYRLTRAAACQLGRSSLPERLHRWVARAGDHEIVRHTCNNPQCVKRAHLSAAVGSASNVRDSWRKGRRRALLKSALPAPTTTLASPARYPRSRRLNLELTGDSPTRIARAASRATRSAQKLLFSDFARASARGRCAPLSMVVQSPPPLPSFERRACGGLW